MKDVFFSFVIFLIVLMQYTTIIQNIKNDKKYDNNLNVFYILGIIISLYFVSHNLKRYIILLYGFSAIILMLYLYIKTKNKKNDNLVYIRKDLIKLILVFIIIFMLVVFIVP